VPPPGIHARSEPFVEVVRVCVVVLFTAAGFEAGGGTSDPNGHPVLGATLGAAFGYVVGGVIGRLLRRVMGTFEREIDRAPAAELVAGALGAVLLGGLGALLGVAPVVLLPGSWGWPVFGLLTWVGVYAGFTAGVRKGGELLRTVQRRPVGAPVLATDARPGAPLVDTSAAVDGRLRVLVDAGLTAGPLLVPRFVLDELQALADAADQVRRRRGRRALELLEFLRTDPSVGIEVLDDEVPEVDEVDAKLVVLARRLDAVLVTVDGNLQRVAELQGVRCLNVERLSDDLRGPLVPGEVVRVPIVRAGSEPGQGVGFLEDGTMVVVSGGAGLVGREADVMVISSVRTTKGRMFFASLAGA
jgi:uncharacterized protein YacL